MQTLHTTVFTVLMEEAGKLVSANEDDTKLTDMNDALAQQKARRGSSSSRKPTKSSAASQLRRRFAR